MGQPDRGLHLPGPPAAGGASSVARRQYGRYQSGGLVWGGRTDYAVNLVAFANRPTVYSTAKFTDGLSNTIFAGEKAFDVDRPGAKAGTGTSRSSSAARRARRAADIGLVRDTPGMSHEAFKDHWGSPHPGGVQFPLRRQQRPHARRSTPTREHGGPADARRRRGGEPAMNRIRLRRLPLWCSRLRVPAADLARCRSNCAADAPAARFAFRPVRFPADTDDLPRGPRACGFILPAPTQTVDQTGLYSYFSLAGDFEVSADYELLSMPKPQSGYGVTCGIAAGRRRGRRHGRLGPRRDGRQGWPATSSPAATVVDRETKYETTYYPSAAKAGRLILRREKAEVICLAADGPQAEPRELVRLPFSPATVRKVRIYRRPGRVAHQPGRADDADPDPGRRDRRRSCRNTSRRGNGAGGGGRALGRSARRRRRARGVSFPGRPLAVHRRRRLRV